MLEFEHLIQINDLSDGSLTPLSRTQLWHGLLLRARQPDKFNPALESRIERVSETEFLRFITAGSSRFEERVLLSPMTKIASKTAGGSAAFLAESLVEIEEIKSGFLFVRFTYRRELVEDDDQVNLAEHLKSAYVQMDRDAIRQIRELANSGALETMIN